MLPAVPYFFVILSADLATSCYEHAAAKFPNNLDLMMGLFNCYVRESSFVKQQQVFLFIILKFAFSDHAICFFMHLLANLYFFYPAFLQTAIKMYKIASEERFLLWAVCSIQLQVLNFLLLLCRYLHISMTISWLSCKDHLSNGRYYLLLFQTPSKIKKQAWEGVQKQTVGSKFWNSNCLNKLLKTRSARHDLVGGMVNQ